MTATSLEMSPYSNHYKLFKNYGIWILETTNPRVKNVYFVFQTCILTLCTIAAVSLCVNLCVVFGDIRKMTWNICINVFFLGWLIKHMYTLYRWKVVNRLRRKLHANETTVTTADDEHLNEIYASQMKKIVSFFHTALVIILPIWLMCWYFGLMWGERDIPIPLWLPFKIDNKDDFQFNISFIVVSTLGVLAVIFLATVELAMFSLLIQISREYTRLIRDLSKINDLFEGEVSKKPTRETNPHLREMKIKKYLKEYSRRQRQLIEYTRDFELIYRYPMLLQLFAASVLLIVTALQCLMEAEISLNLVYVLGYLFMILLDMLLFCWFSTRIRSQCLNVGDAAYSMVWYRMDAKIRRDISMMILRSQHPPKITAGKVIQMDLRAFMLMIKNIYSCLTVFNQVAGE